MFKAMLSQFDEVVYSIYDSNAEADKDEVDAMLAKLNAMQEANLLLDTMVLHDDGDEVPYKAQHIQNYKE